MDSLTTRLADPADLDTVAKLFDAYRQFYEQAPDLARARAFIGERMARRESTILLAEDTAGTVVGFCQLYPTFCSVEAVPILTLYDLYVDPAARRAGAGRTLLQAAETHARQGGFRRMDLTTARTNLAAQSLYASLGWVRDDVFLAYNRWVAA